MIRRGMLTGLLFVAFVLPACSDEVIPPDGTVMPDMDVGVDAGVPDTGEPCSLEIAAINTTAVADITQIDGTLDKDDETVGIQLDVEVGGSGLANGTEVQLHLTGQTVPVVATANGGKAVFSDVTVSTSIDRVLIRATATDCAEDSRTYTVVPPPECVFLDPRAGATLGLADDKVSGNDTFDYDVEIKTTKAVGGKISLTIDGIGEGEIDPIPGSGNVTFSDKVFSAEEVELVATVELDGVVRRCRATVTVDTGRPTCRLSFTPALVALTGGQNGLGVAQDALPSTDGIESNIAVETRAGATVTLLIDGSEGSPRTADGSGNAAFNAEPLADGERLVQAHCVDEGSGNDARSAEVTIRVDSEAPAAVQNFSCSLTQPRLGRVTCQWTSAGPVEVGAYLLRYATDAPITEESSWDSAAATEKSIVPYNANQTQSVIFDGLPISATYYISIRAADAVQNLSDLAGGTATAVEYRGGPLVGFPEPANATSNWGAVMASGDFNCDGFTDLAVGDPLADSSKGRVSIYRGSPNGYLAAPEKFILGTVAGGRFGAGLAALRNFDNDSKNCTDLAVYASHGTTSAARVYVYLGREQLFDRDDVTTGKGAELILALPTTAGANEVLGERIAGAGDFNGDGVTDLALSHRDTGGNTASVLIVFGVPGRTLMGTGIAPTTLELPAGASVRITGGTATGGFGLAIGGGAPLEGTSDTYADLLIGAPSDGKGKAYVVLGGTALGEITLSDGRVTTITGGTDNVAFGEQVAFVGNLDNSGMPEFAVADPSADLDAGRVYLFNLTSAPGGPADAVMTLTNDVTGATGDRFGMSLAAGGGDIDDDGRADLLIGCQQAGAALGVVYQFNGAANLADSTTSQANYVFSAPAGASSFGTNVLWLEDVNGDDLSDLVIADPLYSSGGQTMGRVYLYY